VPTEFKVSNFTHNENMKGDTKWKMENGVVWGSYGSLNVTGNSAIR